jgi:hypothetical protein
MFSFMEMLVKNSEIGNKNNVHKNCQILLISMRTPAANNVLVY